MVACGCGQSTASLSQQAKSADPAERLHAVKALEGRPGEASVVVPVLIEALDDENKFVRRDAAKALGRFGPAAKDAVPALTAKLSDPDPSVRKAAETALKQIGSPAAK